MEQNRIHVKRKLHKTVFMAMMFSESLTVVTQVLVVPGDLLTFAILAWVYCINN